MKMKFYKIFFLLLLLSLLNTCDTVETNNGNNQITPGDDSLIPDSIKSLMKEDAAFLTLRDVYLDSAKKETLVILPENSVESYYSGFVHIYNADTLPARDSVIEMYKIHAFPIPAAHSIIVAIDSTKDWVEAWKNGERLTGNQQIDDLMETYDLQLDRYYRWPLYHAAVLSSDNPINIYALSKKFASIDGVIYAEPNGVCCDGNNITGSLESDYIMYEFSFGWGDCIAGCASRHYWVFQVKFNGAVIFISSFGDPLP
jgi:hypothetical protein